MKSLVLSIVFTLATSYLYSMPTRDQLKAVQSTVAELMADDMAALKTGKIRPEDAAKNAEKLAAIAKEEPARFLLYKGAFGLYVQGGKYAEALASLNKLTAGVKDVSDKVLAEIVREKLKRVNSESGGEILSYYAKLERRVRYAAEKRDAKKLLDERPDDAVARRRLAVALAMLDDWPAALAEFAKLENDERQAADAERGGNAAEAADLWWSCSDPNDEGVQDGFREHAAALYTQALKAGKLEGLKKVLAEKRIAEATGKPFDIGTATAAASPQSHGRAASPLAAAGTAPPAGTAAVELPKPDVKLDTRKLSPVKIPLKGAPALEFVPIPAGFVTLGTKRRSQTGMFRRLPVAITRPFLMAKTPLTFAQWKAITGSQHGFEVALQNGSCRPEQVTLYRKLGGPSLSIGVCRPSVLESFLDQLNGNAKYKRMRPTGYVFRVPTLAEYEYVECGGDPSRDGDSRYEGDVRRPWISAENVTPSEIMLRLQKGGVDVSIPSQETPFFEQLKQMGPYCLAFETSLLPVGTKPPNPYGVCDLFPHTMTFDRLGPELRLPEFGTDRQSYTRFMDACNREKAGTIDPLFWTTSSGYYGTRRGYYSQIWPYDNQKGLHYGVIRLVIGPDLVKEWKARKKGGSR